MDTNADRAEIDELVRTWAAAVHSRDLETVLARHADDIVMFDVPPPHDGVRGIAAYRDSWPQFFEWLATTGGTFEIVELDITVGVEVAYAWALLKCSSPEALAAHPEDRLRLSLGLRKQDGAWVVAHEHHSFCDTSTPG